MGSDSGSGEGAILASATTLAKLGERGDENACLDHLRDLRFPDGTPCPGCTRATRFHRIRGRSAYACQYCRHHVYPKVDTFMTNSPTPLHHWFRAIALVQAGGGAVRVAELERELGVTRKTAARMRNLILPLVDGGDEVNLAATPAPISSSESVTRPPVARDPLREELLGSIEGLRDELQEAEDRAKAAVAEAETLRAAIRNLESLVGAAPARPLLRPPRSAAEGA